jgi:hypothetical protein
VSTPPREPTEQEYEQLRAAYEEEMKRIRADDVVIQTAVTLINLAGRRLGLAPGAEGERDLEQVRDAIDAVRGLMPVLERRAGPDLAQLRSALSQLQMAYASEAAAAPAGAGEPPASGAETPTGAAPQPAESPADSGSVPPSSPAEQPSEGDDRRPGPAESSGRLWIPGR